MKLRLIIIIVGALVSALTIHFIQEHDRPRNRRWGQRDFRDSGPRGTIEAPPPRRGGRGPGSLTVLEVSEQFDLDNDGLLNASERAQARDFVTAERARRGGPPRRDRAVNTQPGPSLTPDQIQSSTTADLYDETVLRTLFLRFPNDQWEDELADFWKTDIAVPASLHVDSQDFDHVGVRFRGTSSFFTVPQGLKRSLNISVDHGAPKNRLYGYKTLNLLNAHTDPSFVRTALFSHIARHYIPAPKANYLHVVINGESWGIYVNSQQFNKDFLDDWYGRRGGIRWKMLPNPRGGNGLGYLGDDPTLYERQYLMKSAGDDRDWATLINVFRILSETPLDKLEATLDPIFNIDQALWFLALENVFVDNDGYWVRASDFAMYADPRGRLHMIPHDSNETFRLPRGPGFDRTTGEDLDPFYGLDDPSKPLIHRLLSVPQLKARYIAHIRTLKDEWLDEERVTAIATKYQALIKPTVLSDTKKHETNGAFLGSLEGPAMPHEGGQQTISIAQFVAARREFLDHHPALSAPAPVIKEVTHGTPQTPVIHPQEPALVRAQLQTLNQTEVILRYSQRPFAAFKAIKMNPDEDGSFTAEIPPQESGEKMFYYVEARDVDEGTSSFFPRETEFNPLSYRVTPRVAEKTQVRLSELMATNTKTVTDPQGEYEDWIELENRSTSDIDLSGYYLSDTPKKPKKWPFPEATVIAAKSVLLVWADDDTKDDGLHTNFKLAKQGETIGLYDRDDRGNQLLDEISYRDLSEDEAWGLNWAADGASQSVSPTPGQLNP